MKRDGRVTNYHHYRVEIYCQVIIHIFTSNYIFSLLLPSRQINKFSFFLFLGSRFIYTRDEKSLSRDEYRITSLHELSQSKELIRKFQY